MSFSHFFFPHFNKFIFIYTNTPSINSRVIFRSVYYTLILTICLKRKGEPNIDKRRIYDRILEQCTPILVDGKNKREKTVKENMSYFKKLFGDKE